MEQYLLFVVVGLAALILLWTFKRNTTPTMGEDETSEVRSELLRSLYAASGDAGEPIIVAPGLWREWGCTVGDAVTITQDLKRAGLVTEPGYSKFAMALGTPPSPLCLTRKAFDDLDGKKNLNINSAGHVNIGGLQNIGEGNLVQGTGNQTDTAASNITATYGALAAALREDAGRMDNPSEAASAFADAELFEDVATGDIPPGAGVVTRTLDRVAANAKSLSSIYEATLTLLSGVDL